MLRRGGSIALWPLVTSYAGRVYAGPPFACCYCTSQTSDSRAFLCEAIPSSDIPAFETACEAQAGDTFPCVVAVSPDACPAYFATQDIICPRTAPAPVLGASVSAALAAILVGLGVIGLRARRRVTAPR